MMLCQSSSRGTNNTVRQCTYGCKRGPKFYIEPGVYTPPPPGGPERIGKTKMERKRSEFPRNRTCAKSLESQRETMHTLGYSVHSWEREERRAWRPRSAEVGLG